jgi:hypothetical protein
MMKVNIGKYTNWVGPYQLANKFEWLIGEDKADKLGDWLNETWVKDFCKWVDSKKKRKITVKIDYWDTWSLDHTLALIILPALKECKECKEGLGSPFTNDEDVPVELRSTSAPPNKDETGTDDLHDARWEWIVNEMIWSFQQIVDDNWETKFYHRDKKDHERYDVEGHRKYQERISKGLVLFGKYYQALWT